MTLTPQPYPLWLAQVLDDEIQVGRIIAWRVADPRTGHGDSDAVAQPIVVFADDNGYVWATMQASRTAARFICDNRGAAADAAEKWVHDHSASR
jgi:hypothetical protein